MKARVLNSILHTDEYDVVSVDLETKDIELEIRRGFYMDFSYAEVEIIE